MNPLRANFQELYERHLCRHSQFGINVGHILCVIGTYISLYAILYALFDSPPLILGITVPYLAILALNVPVRVFAVLLIFLALFFLLFFSLPKIPIWASVITIVVLYK